jgi:hypothetical protein
MVQEAKRQGLRVDDSRFRNLLDKQSDLEDDRRQHPLLTNAVSKVKVLRFLSRWLSKHHTSDDRGSTSTDFNQDYLDTSIHESLRSLWTLLEIMPIRRLDYLEYNSTTNT